LRGRRGGRHPHRPDDTWADLFSRVLVEKVEPSSARPGHHPLRIPDQRGGAGPPNPRDPRVAERFELYACGVELANAFGELTDPPSSAAASRLEMDEKERVYGERYPLDEDFLAALAVMPEASGIALGFDRLVMLATGAARIEDR
jgi:lysyl-tRNA synthetase class 2